jgi:hypothetical protein
LRLLGKGAYILVEFLLERTQEHYHGGKFRSGWFCKGVLLGNILLSEFGRWADTENSAFTSLRALAE